MITLGEIKSIDQSSNLCVVKLPTLEGVGNKTKVELSATMMLPPGINAGYEEGDVVFVSFVDNSLGRPTVLGQLYRGPGRGTKIDGIGRAGDDSLGRAKTISCVDLDVKSAAKIPQTTELVNAASNYNSPAKLISHIKDLESQVTALENELTQLKVVLGAFAAAGMLTAVTDPGFATASAGLAAGVVGSTIL
jgi:hypothetical protein